MTLVLALMVVTSPAPAKGELRHEIDVLGGLVPNHTYAGMATVTASYTLVTSDQLGWQVWGSWVGSWNKRLARELERVAASQGQGSDIPFPRPAAFAGASVQLRLPYDETVESRLHFGPMALAQTDLATSTSRWGGGVFLGGGLRWQLVPGLSGIADVGGMVYSLAERPVEVSYLLTVRVGVGFTI